jgi:hypothetical protein
MDQTLLSELLSAWEETHKKGQLTFWIFLALQKEKKYVDEIKEFVEAQSKGTNTCKEQSLYRAFENMNTFRLWYMKLEKVTKDLSENIIISLKWGKPSSVSLQKEISGCFTRMN